jgi:hypothetical protein
MAPAEEAKKLEKSWAEKQNGLDLYGKAAERAAAGVPACAHSNLSGYDPNEPLRLIKPGKSEVDR